MTPPEAEGQGRDAKPDARPAVSVCEMSKHKKLSTLRHRSDFLRAASARRHGTAGLLVQARDRADQDPSVRVGFTCSKKIGNAVARNRAKRRLRMLAHQILTAQGRPGWDYVLVGRPGATIDRDFALLLTDLETAVARLHAPSGPSRK